VWTVWGEGAAFATNGGSVHFGDPVDAGKAHWGGEAAAGFDVRLGVTPWHVSADVRYGSAKNSGTFARNGMIAIPSNTPTFGTAPGVFNARVGATGSFTQREQHELADFAAGRDVGLGIGQMQVKAGLRIAEIASKTGGSANFVAPTLYSAGVFGHGLVGARPGAFSFEQQSRFAGGGPRVGVEGAVPLGGGWALDYLGGMAGLYGARSFGVTTGGTAAPFGFNEAGASDNTVVFNLDAQAGLSYWLMPSLKVTAGYRFDGYWGALKTLDANGNLANADRFYMGPTLRLTGRF
jgi:Legionella pneumophila major outer membrane protein precursor